MRRRDSLAVEAAFRTRVAELGGVVLEPSWLGARRPHQVRCAAGHDCAPRPYDVGVKGHGPCRVCAVASARRSERSLAAEAAFRARVAELGGVVLEPSWLGVDSPHRVRCAAGHECSPTPNGMSAEQGLCRVCAGNDPATAEAAFRARVAELGGVVLEPSWLGANRPHRVRCAAGHECSPCPASVRSGHGLCRVCAGMQWDRFYVVVNRAAARVKLGITSGLGQSRLARHRSAGYFEVVRSLAVPGANDLERAVLSTLSLGGVRPVRGREYFDVSALGLVLDVVDAWPVPEGVS